MTQTTTLAAHISGSAVQVVDHESRPGHAAPSVVASYDLPEQGASDALALLRALDMLRDHGWRVLGEPIEAGAGHLVDIERA